MDSIPMYDLVITQPIRMLSALSLWLEKGEKLAQQRISKEPDVLLQSRLVFDQFPLVRQIQIACDTAKLTAARFTGKEAPKHPDTEKTWGEAKARIGMVISYLKTFKPEDFKGSAQKQIQFGFMEGKYMEGHQALLHVSIPNLYFHVTTAYAILRANGVEIGKADYYGPDLPWKSL